MEAAGDKVKIVVRDPVLDENITISADLLTLAAAVDPGESTKQLGQLFKVTVNSNGYFVEAHMKLRPVDFTTEGVFLAGLAHYPKPIDESIAQATAAAQRAAIILSKDEMTFPGVISKVDGSKCAVCLTCVRLCPYGAPAYYRGACRRNRSCIVSGVRHLFLCLSGKSHRASTLHG